MIREEKEKKWNDDLEEERRLIAQRDAVRERMEAEDTRHQQKEVFIVAHCVHVMLIFTIFIYYAPPKMIGCHTRQESTPLL